MPEIPLYDDSNYQELLNHPAPRLHLPRRTVCGSVEAMGMGLHPVLKEFPDALPAQSEWKAIIEACNTRQIFPVYHMRNAGMMKN